MGMGVYDEFLVRMCTCVLDCVRVNVYGLRMTNTRKAHRAGRQLVLIDIENLIARSSPTCEEVGMAKDALRQVVADFDDAQQIVACSHHAAPTVAFAFGNHARHLWRSGPDGADLALLDVLEYERVDERFERVTICSGDGIFTASAASLATADVEVTVISLPGHLSTRLRLAAQHLILLPPVASTAATESAS